ncbi:MAG TPA: glycosyltransferase family 9 protein [Verrucomicrobiae bacterium]|nr:glycosyltransferase family 9 protein [Verrucomicrobiae bacterium]
MDAKKTNRPFAVLSRHAAALGYVLRVVLPVILRTGRRPVIFSRLIGMGDIICTVPAALELKKRHPGATFIYNCQADFAAVPRMAGLASQITSFSAIGLVGHWYDFLLGGFYHFMHGDDTPGQTSQASMVEEFCRQFDVPVTEEHALLTIDPALREKAETILRGKNLDPKSLVIIHPGPSWPVREWPAEKWPQLVAGLRAAGFTSIAQLGVGRYANFGEVELATVPGAVSLINQLSLEEAFAVISLARLHIGIDSGLLHVAATVGTPGVGIFGMTSPQFRFSREYRRSFVVSEVECQGCYHRLPRIDWVTNCPYDIRCMKEIGVDRILQVCLSKLNPTAR